MNAIHLDATDLVLATLLVLLNAGASLMLHLRLHRQVLWAATRMVVQLLLVGLVLRFVFRAASPVATLTIVILMILAAGPINELRSIITGWYRTDPPAHDDNPVERSA